VVIASKSVLFRQQPVLCKASARNDFTKNGLLTEEYTLRSDNHTRKDVVQSESDKMNIAIKVAMICGAAAVIIGAVSGTGSSSNSIARVSAAQLPIPSDQMHFIGAVTSARTSYKNAANELAAGSMRSSRQQAICNAVINQQASDWVGRIETLTSNGDGKGVVSLSTTEYIHIATWNNGLSDIRDNTLIDPNASMFKQLAALKVGDLVIFSGRFSSSNTDCVGEQSVTLQGSMTSPAFTMRFTSIRKL
jgi:hypothetical protein